MESKPIVGVITNETVGFNGRQLSHSAGKRYVDAVMNFAECCANPDSGLHQKKRSWHPS